MAGPDIPLRLPSAVMLTCPSCSGKLRYAVPGQTQYIGCLCGTLSSVRGDELRAVKKYKMQKKPGIPIGSRGKLNNILYEVVGYIYGKEKDYKYYWNEYVLFNPLHGYAFLVEFDGHWNYIVQTDEYPRDSTAREFSAGGRDYKLYHKYQSQTISITGEIFWDITTDRFPTVLEYISPPFSLIREETPDEQAWLLAEYKEPAEIKAAFSVRRQMPPREGIGANQRMKFPMPAMDLIKVSGMFAAVIFIIQLFFSFLVPERKILNKTYLIPAATADNKISISDDIELGNSATGVGNLEFYLRSPVMNTWLEMEVNLVNVLTGEEFNFEQGVEYYAGVSGGESWTEGSTSSSRVLSSIPDGNYHVNIFLYTERNAYKSPPDTFSLQVYRDVPMWGNFFWLLIPLLIFPGIQYLREYLFESQRWMNSDYAE